MVKFFLYSLGIAVGLCVIVRLLPKTTTICGVAGKSGGHIVPGLTVIENYLKQYPEFKVLFFSTDTPLDKAIISKYASIHTYVPLKLDNVPGKNYKRYPAFIAQCIGAFAQSIWYLAKQRPQKIVSMGGYISVPVCLAGWLLGVPIELYELNAVPGKAVLWLSPLATKILVCFPQAKKYFNHDKVAVVEYPFRFKPAQTVSKKDACKQLGLNPEHVVLLVLGGSQGSEFINTLIPDFFKYHQNLGKTISVIHQAGSYDLTVLTKLYSKYGIESVVFSYRPDLDICYAAADFVVARAGAGTLFEILFFKKPALIIPLQTTTTAHQKDNAFALQELNPKLFSVVDQKSVEEHKALFFTQLQDQLTELLHVDHQRRQAHLFDHAQ
ncbi:UDP-N-acetylglucosamine--N-acetylmuramyl-(pentapeptide) pyrophosphoryl-undecaprenol N-acetylglucosamine transferase [Candidatus Dependentiae bacterium]|nr:UDP-N-acetylglucosamine--N-acetylmuramyl-(pentapeptide) pyrophosphoryl-undecaprenol N-acetylglucosamine transferase [Candidatus Dependentiae bacterium]